MDCTPFEMRLVEHVTGTLPADARAELEAHLERCEACKKVHADLALGARYASVLPLEPAPALDMRALTAAVRARAATGAMNPDGPSNAPSVGPAAEPSRVRSVVSAVANAPSGAENPRPAFIEAFRRWVTGPQVAMATLTCLVVAIGLTYIPLSQMEMPAAGDTVAAPANAPSPGATAAEAPREEEANAYARGDGSENARFASAQNAAQRAEAFGIEDRAEEMTNATPAPSVAAIVPPAPMPAIVGEAAGDEVVDQLANAEGPLAQARRGYVAPADVTGGAPSEAAAMASASVPSGSAGSPAPSAPPATAAPSAQASRATTTTQTQTAQAATRAADPTTTLAQARAYRNAGSCGAATTAYQRFLNEAGTAHPQRGQAMLELADCLQRTGRTGVARQTLEQAQGVPSVAARARRELESQSTPEQQAPARSARPAAAPRQSDDTMDSAYRSDAL